MRNEQDDHRRVCATAEQSESDGDDEFDDADDRDADGAADLLTSGERVCAILRLCLVCEKWDAITRNLGALREALAVYAANGGGVPIVYVDTRLELTETLDDVSVAAADDEARTTLRDALTRLMENGELLPATADSPATDVESA